MCDIQWFLYVCSVNSMKMNKLPSVEEYVTIILSSPQNVNEGKKNEPKNWLHKFEDRFNTIIFSIPL